MPHPVLPLPTAPRTLTDAQNLTVEAFVEAIAQIFAHGTVGSAVPTPATLTFDSDPTEYDSLTGRPLPKPLLLDTKEKQLYYRQLAAAIITSIGSSTQDPVNLDLFSVTPAPNKVPMADNVGHISPGWLEAASDLSNTFVAECPSNAVVGDLVYPVANWHPTVDFVDIYDYAYMPSIGIIREKADPITCKVQTRGLMVGTYNGLFPGQKYLAGPDHRPTRTIPTAPPNGSVFIQHLGVALDPVTLIFNPSVTVTRVRG
jgi:hypothetical protein